MVIGQIDRCCEGVEPDLRDILYQIYFTKVTQRYEVKLNSVAR